VNVIGATPDDPNRCENHRVAEPTIAVFTMTEAGHFERLRPLVAGLASRGADVHVFADRRFAARARDDGAMLQSPNTIGRAPIPALRSSA
jgi:hypothetical protein